MSQSSLGGRSLKWNILDNENNSGCSLAGFKRKLDRYLRDKREYIYKPTYLLTYLLFPYVVSE